MCERGQEQGGDGELQLRNNHKAKRGGVHRRGRAGEERGITIESTGWKHFMSSNHQILVSWPTAAGPGVVS